MTCNMQHATHTMQMQHTPCNVLSFRKRVAAAAGLQSTQGYSKVPEAGRAMAIGDLRVLTEPAGCYGVLEGTLPRAAAVGIAALRRDHLAYAYRWLAALRRARCLRRYENALGRFGPQIPMRNHRAEHRAWSSTPVSGSCCRAACTKSVVRSPRASSVHESTLVRAIVDSADLRSEEQIEAARLRNRERGPIAADVLPPWFGVGSWQAPHLAMVLMATGCACPIRCCGDPNWG